MEEKPRAQEKNSSRRRRRNRRAHLQDGAGDLRGLIREQDQIGDLGRAGEPAERDRLGQAGLSERTWAQAKGCESEKILTSSGSASAHSCSGKLGAKATGTFREFVRAAFIAKIRTPMSTVSPRN